MTTTDQNKYELMVIISGDLTEGEFEKELGEIRKLLKESSGGIFNEESWGKKDLAFKIKKQAYGYYVIFNFDAPPQNIAELRQTIKLNPMVLRHLLITVPEDFKPGAYKEMVLPEDMARTEARNKKNASMRPPMREQVRRPEPAPILAAKMMSDENDQEKLANVEKKLEKILENPDIDIK